MEARVPRKSLPHSCLFSESELGSLVSSGAVERNVVEVSIGIDSNEGGVADGTITAQISKYVGGRWRDRQIKDTCRSRGLID